MMRTMVLSIFCLIMILNLSMHTHPSNCWRSRVSQLHCNRKATIAQVNGQFTVNFFYDCLSTKSFLCWKSKRSSFAAWSFCCSSGHSHPCCLFRLLSCLSLHYTAAFHRLTQLILLRQFLSLQAENVAWQVHKQVLWQKHSLVPGQASISTKPGPSTSTVWAGWKEHLYSPKGSTCMQRKEHTLNSIG